MDRIYETIIQQHFEQDKQMLFLAGPRQVGKTTISLYAKTLSPSFFYLNWDNQDHRALIMKGPAAVAEFCGLQKISKDICILVLDELHKYKKWKIFLKGFYDTYKDRVHIIVTGSARLDVYRRGGDSLMGRYFPYRVHPFSVAECLRTTLSEHEIQPPLELASDTFNILQEYGGFPEPFIRKNKRFLNRWRLLRKDQLFREDIRDLSRIQEIHQLELLAEMLREQSGQLVSYTNLANRIRVSVDTVRRWIKVLSSIYYCFVIRPWKKNISRSLLKEPKIYLWDWSEVMDPGRKIENMMASHLLKAVHFWTDQGLGHYELFFIRDKNKREVDFVVTRNNQSWFLVEVKLSNNGGLNKHLEIFQRQTGAKHAFQVVFNMDYVDVDCFKYQYPVIVPAKTFLSQLV